MEKIICAAIWYKEQPTAHCLPSNITEGVVVAGLRHPHCIYTFNALTGLESVEPSCEKYVEGFITSEDRFVDRIEAMKIALLASQIINPNDVRGNELYTEDIY